MTVDAVLFSLYYLVVLGGVGAVIGLVAGVLTAAALGNGSRRLSRDMALGAVVMYGSYQLRVYLVLHGVLNAFARPWLEFLLAGLVVVAHEVLRFLLRHRSERGPAVWRKNPVVGRTEQRRVIEARGDEHAEDDDSGDPPKPVTKD
jgi:hypothetical protein